MADDVMYCECGFKAVKGQFNKTKQDKGGKGNCPRCGVKVN